MSGIREVAPERTHEIFCFAAHRSEGSRTHFPFEPSDGVGYLGRVCRWGRPLAECVRKNRQCIERRIIRHLGAEATKARLRLRSLASKHGVDRVVGENYRARMDKQVELPGVKSLTGHHIAHGTVNCDASK